MRLKLTRRELRLDGIFSELTDENRKVLAQCVEHSYDLKPKLYDGMFKCVRGQHQLHSMNQPFTTFEITGVMGHTNILFHSGNWHTDSDGCILVGSGIAQSSKGQMITGSRVAFAELLKLLEGLDTFELEVVT